MSNRKFLFVNSDLQYEEEALSVSSSSGSGDSGKLATLDGNGKWDISFIPDSVLNDRDWKDSVRAATTAALPAVTYDNGTSGVGATLTADANGALPAQDGVTLVVGEYLLVKDQAAGLQNGIYEVTQVGDGSNPFILTRRTDADENSEVTAGQAVPITEGTINADRYALLTTNDPITVGTTALVYAVQNTTNLSAGDGIEISGGIIAVDLVADGGLEFASGELQAKTADTSDSDDLDGTNGIHFISAQDLSSNGANQGAKVLGADPASIPQSSATTIQGILEDLSAAISAGSDGANFTVGAGGVTKGDLLRVSANDTVLPLDITTNQVGIGVAASTESAAGTVKVEPNDRVVTGVLTSLSPTAGQKVWWSGSALTLTVPSTAGDRVWLVGIAKNADDLYTQVEFIKVQGP